MVNQLLTVTEMFRDIEQSVTAFLDNFGVLYALEILVLFGIIYFVSKVLRDNDATKLMLLYWLMIFAGGALYFGCGLSQKQLDEVFSSRFRAERARYLLLAEKAQGAKMAAVDPDSFKKNPPQKALALLLDEYGKLQSRLDKTPLGKVMKEMEALQAKMDAMEFRLCCALELVVTPAMRKNTRRYVRWVAHPDKKYEQLRQRFAAVFARFYRIQDAIWEGKGVGNAEKELPAIRKEAESVIAGLNAWLDNHPEKASIDDPYENQGSSK